MKRLLFLLFLIFFSCNKSNSPTGPDDVYNKILIETDSLSYTWQQGESGSSIAIYGIIKNETDTVFYSGIGDLFSGNSPCCFSGNSDAYLEKYDTTENSWKVNNIASLLYEGTKLVPVHPSQEYSFASHLFTNNDRDETGRYRFRLDYYSQADPDSDVVPFFDYSNEFVLE